MVISNDELESILICFKKLQAKKNQILIEQNKICKHLFFIKKGCLRVVCTRDDGQEWTRQIAIENEFITIFPSFLEQTSSGSYLQTVEASEVFYISYSNFKKLNSIDEHHKMAKIIINFFESDLFSFRFLIYNYK